MHGCRHSFFFFFFFFFVYEMFMHIQMQGYTNSEILMYTLQVTSVQLNYAGN